MATDVGIRIGVDGEQEFKSSLSAINAQLKNLNTEMQSVVSSFEGMEDSEEAVTQKSELLQRTLDVQKQKMDLLSSQYERSKTRLAELSRELDFAVEKFGANSVEAGRAQRAYNRQAAEVNRLGSQMNATEADIRRMQRQLDDTANSVEDLSNEIEEAEGNTSSFGDTLKAAFLGGTIAGAVQSLAGSISSLVDETLEYRKIMGTLETSSEKAGYTADETAESFKQLYGIIGDEQQSATALANLQALGLSQEDLVKMTDAAIGAWATYGDSIPIDGLAESINETIQAGTVTGTFADVLNWAGTSEDDFNAALEACPDKASRVNLVMQELAQQGLTETADAWRQNNEDIVAMQEAEADLKDVTADFGALLTPLIAESKQGLADVLRGVLDLLNGSSPILPLLAGVATGIVGLALPALITNLTTSAKSITIVKTTFSALNAVLKANPIGIVITLLVSLATAFITAYKTNEEFRTAVDNTWNTIKNSVTENANMIIEKIKSLPDIFKQTGRSMINGVKEGMQNAWSSLQSWVSDKINWLTNKLTFWRNSKNEMSSGVGGSSRSIINGSHANGLSYVPFDGYIAQLHKGERVLTAGENRAYTDTKYGQRVQNIFHVQATIREESDIKRVARELYNLQKTDARGKGVVAT